MNIPPSVQLRELLLALESGSRPRGGVKAIETGVPSIGGEHLDSNGGFRFDRVRFVPPDFASAMRRGQIRIGDILVVKDGATTGKVSLVRESFPYPDAVINEHVFLCRCGDRVDPRYAFWYLFSAGGRKQVLSDFRGAAQGGISQRFADLVELPWRPIEEQREIVAEIEKQFSRLDEAVANLERVKAKLALQVACILRAAVDGTLIGKRASLVPGSLNVGEPLPTSWVWATVGELALDEPGSIGAGPFGTIFKAKDFRTEGVPIIFLRHVGPMKYMQGKPGFMDKGKWEELFRPYSVFGGELLVTKLGEPPGACAVYPYGIGPAMVTPDVIKMRVDPARASATYLMYYFNSEIAKRFATGAAFGTTRTRLTLPLFRQMPVVVPPLEDQHRIVAEVERRMSIVRGVVTEIQANVKRAEGLRQAVLARAFRCQEVQ